MKTPPNPCPATIQFGDDHGDNHATFHCGRTKGHKGRHKETGDMGYKVIPMPYTLTWSGSQAEQDAALKRMNHE